jgi:hypothetical protein
MQNLSTTLWYEEDQEQRNQELGEQYMSEAAQSADWTRLLRERIASLGTREASPAVVPELSAPFVDSSTNLAPLLPLEATYAAPSDQGSRQVLSPWEWEGKYSQSSTTTKADEDERWNTWGQLPAASKDDPIDQPWKY